MGRTLHTKSSELFGLLLCLFAAIPAFGDSVNLAWPGAFERNLSVYNLFSDAESQTPNPGLVPYDVITPLFSDYADKHRFVYVPEGAHVAYRADDPFEFPVGAALIKTFSYPRDMRDPARGRRLVETRLMIHTPEGWIGAAYVWNEEQTDARLKIGGTRVPVEWIHSDGTPRSITYLVPNMNQCKICHRRSDVMLPIGLRARHLNRDFSYAEGPRNQIRHWAELGILSGAPAPGDVPRAARFDDPSTGSVADRARAYLDINCAHCHNADGYASHTRLDFTAGQTDPKRRGVYYRPTAAGNASRGRTFAVVPGDPEASFLLHRLISNAPNIRMPEIGRTITHHEGAGLIRDWIEALSEAR